MNPNWPSQHLFVAAVKDFALRRGLVTARGAVQKDQVAARLGLDEKTLHQFLSNKKRPQPALTTLQRCAAAMGVEVSALLAPQRPAVIPEATWRDIPDSHRGAIVELVNLALASNGDDLPIMLELFKRAQELGKARHEDRNIRIN